MNKVLVKVGLSLICGLLVVNCSLFSKKKEEIVIKYPPELKKVHALIIERKTDDARLKIDDYLNRSENIHWFGHAYFLKGFLYELDNNYEESIKYYRSSIQHSAQYDTSVEAKALYNLSFVFEKIQKREELLVSLIDLMKRREFFDVLTGQVEIPARLAAAYASQGKMKEAQIFHREASQNYKSMIRRRRFHAPKEELSKSLYYLGLSVYDSADEKFDQLIRKLSIGQKYFLASAEASNSVWAEKASERLLNQYSVAWGMVLSYNPEGYKNDLAAKKKQRQMRQLVMASDLYDLNYRLRAEEFPMSSVNHRSKKIIDATSRWISKIEKFAMSLSLGPEMIRSKKIKNKKLAIYVEKKKEPVKINKEMVSKKQEKKTESDLPPKQSKKTDIGTDPNL